MYPPKLQPGLHTAQTSVLQRRRLQHKPGRTFHAFCVLFELPGFEAGAPPPPPPPSRGHWMYHNKWLRASEKDCCLRDESRGTRCRLSLIWSGKMISVRRRTADETRSLRRRHSEASSRPSLPRQMLTFKVLKQKKKITWRKSQRG